MNRTFLLPGNHRTINKHIIMRYLAIPIIMLALLTSCHKKDNEVFDTKPNWALPGDVIKEYSMTYIVRVSVNSEVQPLVAADELAAFIGTKCRGTATIVANDSKNCFYLLVYGNQNDNEKLSFRYFSSQQRKIFESVSVDTYYPNQIIGSLDAPILFEF
jgi:hypothetical protein